MQRLRQLGLLCVLPLAFAGPAPAVPIWDEGLDGDLSSDASAPTPVVFGLGSNTVTGSVSAGGGDTRDYLTFTLGAGTQLAALLLHQWEDGSSGGPGNRGFHAINLGATSFVPDAGTIGNFLGSDHLDPAPAGTDLLPMLGLAPTGGTGFTPPLGPGTYTYLVQQTGPQLNLYELEFVVTPEPSTALLVAGALAGLAAHRRRGR